MSLLAAALAAVTTALVVGPAGGRPEGAVSLRPGVSMRVGAVLLGALAGALVILLRGTDLAVGLVALGATAGAVQVWRRGRVRRALDGRRTAVVELGEVLVGELLAGQPVARALARGQEAWPVFAPVAGAARLGANVPAALRLLAREPGAEGLREVAAAWQVSEHSGAPLVSVLAHVVESARARQATAALVRAELSSAQATARLVAVLPLATLAMSSGVGADPWGFLLHRPAGVACLGAGVALVLAGLWWIDRIAAAVTSS